MSFLSQILKLSLPLYFLFNIWNFLVLLWNTIQNNKWGKPFSSKCALHTTKLSLNMNTWSLYSTVIKWEVITKCEVSVYRTQPTTVTIKEASKITVITCGHYIKCAICSQYIIYNVYSYWKLQPNAFKMYRSKENYVFYESVKLYNKLDYKVHF